ncbi:MAG: hypothetical protein ACOC47_04330 [Alkalispirochaetaceae bacterium]
MVSTQKLVKKLLLSVSLIALILGAALLVTSCDSPTGSGNADDDHIVLGDGSVVVTELAPDSLPVGQNAIFTLSLDLPAVSGSVEGYRVWVYPKNGEYSAYCYQGSDVLNARERGVKRWAFTSIPESGCERAAGTVDEWTVSISQWDGSDNTSFATYAFDHTVVWE